MSGRKSKSKGYRNEILLRDELRKAGYESERVPMSGAIASMPGDVRYKKDELSGLVEVKSRKSGFGSLYDFMQDRPEAYIATNRFNIHVGWSLDQVLWEVDNVFIPYGRFEAPKAIAKLEKIHEWVKGCNVLAIKDDRKPFIYIRYYE